jgi:hypothetical protein
MLGTSGTLTAPGQPPAREVLAVGLLSLGVGLLLA